MKVLVVYASRYGATQGIAERIAQTLTDCGQQAEAISVSDARSIDGHDAYVVGGAVYAGSWMKEATNFVRRNAALLNTKPLWLFASGPVGTEANAPSPEVQKMAVPKEFAEFTESVHPREEQVFFGAFDHTKLHLQDRLIYAVPAAKKILPDGDFRDWDQIDSWAKGIAASLLPAAVS